MSINVRTNVKTLDRIQKHINYVNRAMGLQKDKKFKAYLEEKFLNVIIDNCKDLPKGATTDSYIANNKVRDIPNGFVIYNDTTVATDSKGYGGEFSIALVFEYGTGLVGQENAKLGAWQYNVNGHTNGWYYFKNDELHWTRGVEGYEVYRNSLEAIKLNITQWTKDYIGGKL